MKIKDELPLQAESKSGAIFIQIGKKSLRNLAASHPDFWDGESGMDSPNIKVTDVELFAREIELAINEEDEDGSTLLSRMIDTAIKNAVEMGCEGVEHE